MTQSTYDAVYERDYGRCVMCGARQIQAHHIIYRSEQGPHTVENLVMLCAVDHGVVHSDKKKWQPVLLRYTELRSKGVHVLKLSSLL